MSVAESSESVSTSQYATNDVASYSDSYANYYAQYLPEAYGKQGSIDNYYQSYLKNAQKYAKNQ